MRPYRQRAPFAMLIGTLACCSPAKEVPRPEPLPIESMAPVIEASTLAADGVEIRFDVRGDGDTALVFVHCWACDREFFGEQLDYFSDAYLVVALDVAGHGESGSGREDWSLDALADDVVAVVRELELERVILVGHSMGGPLSLLAAAKLPGTALGVTCLDSLHDASVNFPPEAIAGMAARYEQDFEGAMSAAVGAMFPEGSDPQVRDWVLAKALDAEPDAVVAVLRGFADFDAAASLAGAGVPVRCVNAGPPPGGGLATDIEANRQFADFDAQVVEGVGHYLHLERPLLVNELLAAYFHEMAQQ